MIKRHEAAARTLFFHLVAVALLAAPHAARAAGAATGDCAKRAGEFRECLEVVTEAVIDGRSAAVPPAADSARSWWRVHGSSFGAHPDVDPLLSQLVTAAHAHHPVAAAHLAVGLSTQSFAWCPGALSRVDQMMVLDLTGMAAWVRAKGTPTDAPANSATVSDSVAVALDHAKHAQLATRLRTTYAAVQPSPGGKPADVKVAVQMLDLVDDIEKVLH